MEIVESTLTIDPAPAAVTTGSASKLYDGTPLTSSEASVSGIVDADKDAVKVTATGSITEIGTAENTYTIDWGTAKSSNYTLSETLGTLEVTQNDTEVTFTAPSDSKTYDGTPLQAGEVTVTGLPEGFTYTAAASGSQTDAGSSETAVDSYKILNADGNDVTAGFSNIKTVKGTLTVNPAAVTITTESASKQYDGKPLNGTVSVSGIPDAEKEKIKVTATGSITEVGTTESSYTIDWGDAKSSNYTVSETIGTLEVTKNSTEITFTSASAEKTYDGTPLTATAVTAEGLPDGFTFVSSAGGSFAVINAGSYPNSFDDMSYSFVDENGNEMAGWRKAMIKNADGKDVTDNFSNLKFVEGTLTIKALDVIFELNSYDTEFNGQKVLPDGMDGTYGDGGEVDEEYENMEVDEFNCPVHLTCAYRLTGGGEIQIDVDGYSDAGTYDYEPVKTFLAGTESNYNVSYTNTGFTISPLTVNLNVKDGSCVVDGGYHQAELIGASCGEETAMLSSLGENEWRLAGYTIFPSEYIDVKMEDGGGLDAGTYPITYSYSYGNNDPGNYKIIEPTVTKTVIEPLIFSIDLGGHEITYDSIMHGGYLTVKYENGPSTGEELMAYKENQTVSGIITNSYTLPIGGDLTIVAGNAGPDAGTYKLDCETTFNAGNSDNYKLNITGDELIINPRSVPLETGSAEETYDPANPDKPVTNSEAVIHNLAFDDQEAVTVTATGAQIEIGSSANTYSIDWGSVNPDNYIIVEHLGTLTKKAPTGGIDIIDDPMGHSEKSKDSKAGSSADTGSSADKDKDAADDGSKTGSDQSDDNSKKEDQTPEQPDNDSKKEEPKDQTPDQSDKDSKKEEPKDQTPDQSDKDSEKEEPKHQTPDQSDNKSEKEDQTPDQPEKPENNSKNEEQKEQKEQASEQSGKSSEKNDSKAEQPAKSSESKENKESTVTKESKDSKAEQPARSSESDTSKESSKEASKETSKEASESDSPAVPQE